MDTGSRLTAFPCSGNNYVEGGGCEGCGMLRNGVGEEDDYVDGEYIAANSVTFAVKVCQRNIKLELPSCVTSGHMSRPPTP